MGNLLDITFYPEETAREESQDYLNGKLKLSRISHHSKQVPDPRGILEKRESVHSFQKTLTVKPPCS